MNYYISYGYYILELLLSHNNDNDNDSNDDNDNDNDNDEKSTKNIDRTKFQVHMLVALTFLENPNKYKYVNHIDGNKLNNNVENLQWCEHDKDILQKKKVNQIDMKTKKIIKTYESVNDAFRDLNKIYGSNIRLACEGKRNSAFGYKWSFV